MSLRSRANAAAGARAAVVAPAALALALYVPRACPTVAALGDSTELVTVGAVHGVAHAPGFPLYVMFAEAFARLPFLSPAHWLNLSSALFHAAAVALVAGAVWTLTRSLVSAIAGGLVLALSRSFVLGSLYAEVFPLNDLAFAALLWLAILVWRARGDDMRHASARAPRLVAAVAIVTGLASADQQTIVLAAPALAALVLLTTTRAVRARPARLALYLGLFLLPLVAGYALLLHNASSRPAVSWGAVHDARSLARLFTRADYWDYFLHRPAERSGSGGHVWGREALFFRLVWEGAGPLACLFAGVGLIACSRRDPIEGAALSLAFLGSGPVFAAVLPVFSASSTAMVGIAERFVTMPLVPLAILAGAAVGEADRWCRRHAPGHAAWISPSALAALEIFPMVHGALAIDLRADRAGEALAADLIAGTPDRSLILVTGDLYVQAAAYACAVERLCGDRALVAPGRLGWAWQGEGLDGGEPELARTIRAAVEGASSRALVAAEIARRPVFVMPDFLVSDHEMADFAFVPELLLVRLYPSTLAAESDWPIALTRARELANGGGCFGCERDPSQRYTPREERLLRAAYVAALSNEAAAARAIFHDEALAERLSARALATAPTEAP